MRQSQECSFCHVALDPKAIFCDTCGTPHDISRVYQVRSEMQQSVDTLSDTLLSLENTKAELTKEIESLITQLHQSEAVRKSEEATIEVLQRQRLQLEQLVKPITRKKGHLHETLLGRRPRGVRQGTHMFIGRYEGKEDWNSELAKQLAQFELLLDHTTYSVSREKIVFNVIGSGENIERLAGALNGVEGFVNLRSEFANAKRDLREAIHTRRARQEQLDALNKTPWYKGGTGRGLVMRKAELSQQLARDDMQIKALSENLKTLENLLGANAPPP